MTRAGLTVALLSFAGMTAAGGAQTDCPGCAEPPAQFQSVLQVNAAPVAFVSAIDSGSPADRAGLAAADLIVAVNGEGLRHHLNLQGFLSRLREFAMLSRAVVDILKYDPVAGSYSRATVELRVPADPDVRLGIAAGFEAVIVDVPETGPAARAGLRPWEFFEAVDGRSISGMRSVLEVDQAVARAAESGAGLRLTLRRWKPLPRLAGERQSLTYSDREVVLDPRTLRTEAMPPRP